MKPLSEQYQELRDKAIKRLSTVQDLNVPELYFQKNPTSGKTESTVADLPKVEVPDDNAHHVYYGYVDEIYGGQCQVFLLGEDYGQTIELPLNSINPETLFELHDLIFGEGLESE